MGARSSRRCRVSLFNMRIATLVSRAGSPRSQRGLLLAVVLLAACGGDPGVQAENEKLVVVIGADNIPLSFDETLPALQTGLIECGQSGAGQYLLSGIADEAPHYTLTTHAYDSGVQFANAQWYESLPQEARQVLIDALDVQQENRDLVREVIAAQEREWQDEGRVTFYTLTGDQKSRWREAARGSHEKLISRIGGRAREIYDLIQAGKAEFAASRENAT